VEKPARGEARVRLSGTGRDTCDHLPQQEAAHMPKLPSNGETEM